VNHTASSRFWRCYGALPAEVRDLADKNFRMLNADPSTPRSISSCWRAKGSTAPESGCSTAHLICRPPLACIGSGSAPTRTTTAWSAVEPAAFIELFTPPRYHPPFEVVGPLGHR
jgi:hypothetical protein